MRAQRLRDGLRLGRMLETPVTALGKPAPDRGEEPRGMQVRVDVDHSRCDDRAVRKSDIVRAVLGEDAGDAPPVDRDATV